MAPNPHKVKDMKQVVPTIVTRVRIVEFGILHPEWSCDGGGLSIDGNPAPISVVRIQGTDNAVIVTGSYVQEIIKGVNERDMVCDALSVWEQCNLIYGFHYPEVGNE